MRPRSRSRTLAFAAAATLLGLAVIEGGVRLVEPPGAVVAADVWSPLPFQQLPDEDFLREVPGGWRFHPQVVNHAQQTVPAAKAPDELRVVVVGGSTAAGDGLPYGEGPVELAAAALAEALPDREVRVLNLGRSGFAANQVATVLDATIDRLAPDVVLAFLGNNERHDIANIVAAEGAAAPVLRARALRRHLAIARLVQPPPPPPPAPDAPAPEPARQWQIPDREAVERYALDRMERGLRRINRTATSRGVPMVMATMAVNWRYESPTGRPGPCPEGNLVDCYPTQMYYRADHPTNDRLRGIARSLDVPLVDLDQVVQRAGQNGVPPSFWFSDYCHYSARGAPVVARWLAAAVLRVAAPAG